VYPSPPQQQQQHQNELYALPFGGFVPENPQYRCHGDAVQSPRAQNAKMVYTENGNQGGPTTPIDLEQSAAPGQKMQMQKEGWKFAQ
jgi:hypothetical protein